MESGVKDFIFISGRDTSENVDPGDDKGGDEDVKEGENIEGVDEYLEDKEDGVEECQDDKAGDDSLEMRAESAGNGEGRYCEEGEKAEDDIERSRAVSSSCPCGRPC